MMLTEAFKQLVRWVMYPIVCIIFILYIVLGFLNALVDSILDKVE